MRALRNPYVMCALVAVAVALGYFRFRAPQPVAAAPPPAKAERPVIAGPDAGIDLDKLGWTPSPTKDPFSAAVREVADSISDVKADVAPEVLNLKAVWLQEAGGWAVINGKILGVGDSILDFRVEKILADGVLVEGPGGPRKVGFKPASARPSPIVASAPSPSKATTKGDLGKSLVKPTTGISTLDKALHTPTLGKPVTLQGVVKAIEQTIAQDSSAAAARPKTPGKTVP